MAVTIKSEHEIELMREAGRILAIVHDELAKIVKPGISTLDIDRKCEEIIRSYDCIPSFLNYQGFPASAIRLPVQQKHQYQKKPYPFQKH